MTNKKIAQSFRLLANLMELHDENPFKIRSYTNAYTSIRRMEMALEDLTKDELLKIKGIGKAIADKIITLEETGSFPTLDNYIENTPAGVIDIMKIKGLGAKKIRSIWKDLKIDTLGELLYACHENRLVGLSGFGKKTQDDVAKQIKFLLKNRDKVLLPVAIEVAEKVKAIIKSSFPDIQIEVVGEVRRSCPVVSKISILCNPVVLEKIDGIHIVDYKSIPIKAEMDGNPFEIYFANENEWGTIHFESTGSEDFLNHWNEKFPDWKAKKISSEQEIFSNYNLPFVIPEMRESGKNINVQTNGSILNPEDIKGMIHSHSLWSDGNASIIDMALATKKAGFSYIAITDHSQSAFYANGLTEKRVLEQWQEIDQLNEELSGIRILKGIESDILSDGSLDYSDEILSQFELVIASVHSNLKMDKAKATQRILNAVSNPYVHMLGHPTSRLLLTREGYPLDHKKIIDACADHKVSIELNANPHRLDMDWMWIPYAMERGVLISINPDAHAIDQIGYIPLGVSVARKGGLTKEGCLNTRDVDEFLSFLK